MWFDDAFFVNRGLSYFLYYYKADTDIKTRGKISIVLSASRKRLLVKKLSSKKVDNLAKFLKGYKNNEFVYDDTGGFIYIEKYFEKLDYSNEQRIKVAKALKSLIEDTKQKIEEILA
jgi:CRISPR/Cas system-associated endonuclease Cas1